MAGLTLSYIQKNSSMMFRGGLAIPLFLVVILAMMTMPVPPFLLDVFFTFNIALALVVLLVTVYSLRPLEFAVFPTILLLATLLRLALNVASTRVVLLEGHNGGDAAGKVIQAFGEVVIGGNYAVGLIVFMILIIINFVVVTKGAGRISEVSARFTLDAMPGKQMAIDADLNAGLIEKDEAKQRREEVSMEADFYGSMDGASKFVRGDAIAGILILVINLIGGLAIGMAQHDLSFSVAMERYALLTIGDGLVAQIPSLLLSTGAAIMVTRVSSAEPMTDQVVNQMFSNPQPMIVAGFILLCMGIIPGMPHFAFLGLGAGIIILAFYFQAKKKDKEEAQKKTKVQKTKKVDQDKKELGWDDVKPVDLLGLEVGYRLIPLVDKAQSGQLLNRIKGVRKKMSQELGFLMPSVHIRDNLDLGPNTYSISLMGVVVGEADIYPDKELAIDPGQVFGDIEGIKTKDPSFGLDAIWIDEAQKDQAQTLGYTVVDAGTVAATHLNQVMQSHAHELLGHDEVQQLVDKLAYQSPKLVESLIPAPLPLSALLKVLQNLLRESVPIRDLRTIAEALADVATKTQDTDVLTAAARVSMSRMIVQNIVGNDDDLPVITLESQLEQLLLQSVQQAKQAGGSDTDAVLEPNLADKLRSSIADAAQKQEIAGYAPVLLASASLRPMLSKFVRYGLNMISVLSYNEIPDNKKITITATVGA